MCRVVFLPGAVLCVEEEPKLGALANIAKRVRQSCGTLSLVQSAYPTMQSPLARVGRPTGFKNLEKFLFSH